MVARFNSMVGEVIARMDREGKITRISREDTAEIENNIAKGMELIKKEYARKQRASRHYADRVFDIIK